MASGMQEVAAMDPEPQKWLQTCNLNEKQQTRKFSCCGSFVCCFCFFFSFPLDLLVLILKLLPSNRSVVCFSVVIVLKYENYARKLNKMSATDCERS